jgi:tRNA 2-selenouridine synthase
MIPPVSAKIDIERFLEMAGRYPVVDVRSPSEYSQGHIPGAINIPLFDDSEREAVGIKYRHEGRSKAVLKGIELTGPSMHLKLSQALKVSGKGKLLVHCWRGGMRSEAMAWLFSLGDIDTEILEGGYKSYRKHILKTLSEKRRMIVLGGMTGSSKTEILRFLKKENHQAIDLEDLASHRGSAFGSLGQPSQPTSEHFANLLFSEWTKPGTEEPVWIEDESRNIGTVFMPDTFYNNMQEMPAVILLMDIETRIPRLVREYSAFPPELLKGAVMKISRRLGMEKAHEAVAAIESGDFAGAIRITLAYYDKTYMHSITRKKSREILYFNTDVDDVDINAREVLKAARKVKWL